MKDAIGFVGFLLVVGAAGFIGAQFRPDAWYELLVKPNWAPPDWLFGPAWTVLYAIVAISGFIVWQRNGLSDIALWLAYMAQLVLNAAWTYLFFELRNPTLALVDICALCVAILTTAVLFESKSHIAGRLLWPYLAWVAFATAVNGAIVFMN